MQPVWFIQGQNKWLSFYEKIIESFIQPFQFIQVWYKWLSFMSEKFIELIQELNIFVTCKWLNLSWTQQLTVLMRKWLNISLDWFYSLKNKTSDCLHEKITQPIWFIIFNLHKKNAFQSSIPFKTLTYSWTKYIYHLQMIESFIQQIRFIQELNKWF